MHPQRARLHNELHARPSIYFEEPAHLHHYAFLDADGIAADILGRLAEVAGSTPDIEAAQEILELGDQTL
ncbi:MAG TPA: DUF3422 family protein, partial [Halomonas sp.]|nr:DUF3422 family protein [Halomonas sp.]